MHADYRFAPLLLLSACLSVAQTSPPTSPVTPASPGLRMEVKEPTPEELKLRLKRAEQALADWPELGRFAKANEEIGPPRPKEKRVVFLGDSITQVWKLEQYFPGRSNYLNRGISGQTTPQMLVRFRADVIRLQPKAVVILAGTNDIAGNTGPMTLEQIEDNYASIAELAKVHKIKVFFCSVLPVHNYTERSKLFFAQRPQEEIVALNRWLRDNQNKYHYTYVDYFEAMVDSEGSLQEKLAADGLHPNAEGYAIMSKVLGTYLNKMEGRR
jgi:lysophospholipase L1-like esterase